MLKRVVLSQGMTEEQIRRSHSLPAFLKTLFSVLLVTQTNDPRWI